MLRGAGEGPRGAHTCPWFSSKRKPLGCRRDESLSFPLLKGTSRKQKPTVQTGGGPLKDVTSFFPLVRVTGSVSRFPTRAPTPLTAWVSDRLPLSCFSEQGRWSAPWEAGRRAAPTCSGEGPRAREGAGHALTLSGERSRDTTRPLAQGFAGHSPRSPPDVPSLPAPPALSVGSQGSLGRASGVEHHHRIVCSLSSVSGRSC